MGYGDDEPPAVRAEPFPATVSGPSGFTVLVLTFISWDVLKITASGGGSVRHLEIDSHRTATEFKLQPTKSGVTYAITAKGCAKAIDGSTNYCSPESSPIYTVAAKNTNSLREFLATSGVDPSNGVSILDITKARPIVSLRSLMGLD